MSEQLLAVLIGGAIGILASVSTTVVFRIMDAHRQARGIRSIAAAEVTAILEKAQRYLNGTSTSQEMAASSPMLVSIASELGSLSTHQAVAYRRVVVLDMEMREGKNHAKCRAAIAACSEALSALDVKAPLP